MNRDETQSDADNRIILNNAIETSYDAIVILDGHSKVYFMNGAAEQLFGYSRDEILGKELHPLIMKKTDYEVFLEALMSLPLNEKGNEKGIILELEGTQSIRGKFDVEFSISAFKHDNIRYSMVIARDISARKKDKLNLEQRLQKYLELAEESPIGILSCDKEGGIIYVNHKVLDILGSKSIEETKMINLLTFPLLVKHGFSKQLQECIHNERSVIFEINYESKWGKHVWLRTHIKPLIYSNDEVGAQIMIDDISEKKLLEEELFLLSITDNLTKAYNRRYFIQNLNIEIERSNRTESNFSVIMMDIDHFKSINDRFGHNTGDVVLKTISLELMKSIRKIDTLARWGGEEFIFLLPETTMHQAVFLGEKLRDIVVRAKIPVVGNVTASFGVACYRPGETADEIVQCADDMMYRAKSAGRNCLRYSQE